MLEILLSSKNEISQSYDHLLAFSQKHNKYNGGVTYSGMRTWIRPDIPNNTMWGSTYGTVFTTDSSPSRMLQHMIPSECWSDHLYYNRISVIRHESLGSLSSFLSVNRNGYQSSTYGKFAGARVVEIIYWDNNEKKIKSYNPYGLTKPKEFILP